MKEIKQIIADEGKVVSTDGKNYYKVLWCSVNSTATEITDEEYDGLKNVYSEEDAEEFEEGVRLRPNCYYMHEGKKFVYMGEETTATTWEEVEDKMAEWYD